jgi:hypothetical protein
VSKFAFGLDFALALTNKIVNLKTKYYEFNTQTNTLFSIVGR